MQNVKEKPLQERLAAEAKAMARDAGMGIEEAAGIVGVSAELAAKARAAGFTPSPAMIEEALEEIQATDVFKMRKRSVDAQKWSSGTKMFSLAEQR